MRKITFNKCSVLLMYICIIGLFAFCYITNNYPPAEFTYCWFGFWVAQAIITCKLQIDKRKKKNKTDFLEAVTPYINEDNVDNLIEKYLGVDLIKKRRQTK